MRDRERIYVRGGIAIIECLYVFSQVKKKTEKQAGYPLSPRRPETLRLPARRAIQLGEAGSADKLVPRRVRGIRAIQVIVLP